MVKITPKKQTFLALYAVGFQGGVPLAFENTSHDPYFPNKKSVVHVVFNDISPIHVRACNEALVTNPTFHNLQFFHYESEGQLGCFQGRAFR